MSRANYMCLVFFQGMHSLHLNSVSLNCIAGYNSTTSKPSDGDIFLEIVARAPSYAIPGDEVFLNVEVYLNKTLAWATAEKIEMINGSFPVMVRKILLLLLCFCFTSTANIEGHVGTVS